MVGKPVNDAVSPSAAICFAIILHRWSISLEKWKRCRFLESRNDETSARDDVRFDELRRELRKPMRSLGISRVEAYQIAKLVARLTWRQTQALALWADGGFDLEHVMLSLGIKRPAAWRIVSRTMQRLERALSST
jgi:hypothetical protein